MTPELKPIDVDALAPPTPELEIVARRRVSEIIKEWARILSIWGSTMLHGPTGPQDETYSIADLAVAAYVQGARDTIAVAASRTPDLTEALVRLKALEEKIERNFQCGPMRRWADEIADIRKALGAND